MCMLMNTATDTCTRARVHVSVHVPGMPINSTHVGAIEASNYDVRSIALHVTCWLEVPEPSATNLACVARLNLWGVEWRGDLVDLASKSHRVIRVVT